jgi:dihydroorotate dehydrogenase subfamily 1
VEQWLEVEYKKARQCRVPLLISIGYRREEICELAPKVEPYADALELSTHYLGVSAREFTETVRSVRRLVDVPLLVKLSPSADIAKFARAAVAGGADALTAINTLGPCLAIDVESGLPLVGTKKGYGWLSGCALRPLAVRCVYEVANTVKVPVVGVGGVGSGRDVVEMLMAGASAVGICTAAILKGPTVFAKIAAELRDFLKTHGYSKVTALVGLTARRLRERALAKRELTPRVEERLCVGCGLCAASCISGALRVEQVARIDRDLCQGCGLCVTRCKNLGIGALAFPE